MPNVVKVQAGYKVQPLSAFLNQPAPPPAAKLDFVLATPENKEIRARLASVGERKIFEGVKYGTT